MVVVVSCRFGGFLEKGPVDALEEQFEEGLEGGQRAGDDDGAAFNAVRVGGVLPKPLASAPQMTCSSCREASKYPKFGREMLRTLSRSQGRKYHLATCLENGPAREYKFFRADRKKGPRRVLTHKKNQDFPETWSSWSCRRRLLRICGSMLHQLLVCTCSDPGFMPVRAT